MEKMRIVSPLYNTGNKNIKFKKLIKDGDDLVITLLESIPLNIGDSIYFSRNIIDGKTGMNKIKIGYSIIKGKSENGLSLRINFPYRDELFLKNITFPEKDADGLMKNAFKLKFGSSIDIIQSDLYKCDNIQGEINDVYVSKRTVMENIDEFKEKHISNGFFIYGPENFDILSPYRDEYISYDEIYCYDFNTDIIPGSFVRFSGSTYIFSKDGINFFPYEETNIFYSNDFISIPIMVNSSENQGLLKEEIMKDLVEDLREDCVPDYIDMERCIFEPYYEKDGELHKIKEIVINPHFRRRILPGWNTQDNLPWAQGGMSGIFTDEEINRGDSLKSMNFMLDDVKNKKKKISMSFFRLSFYDKNEPMSQMLLYYSTIFLDVNEFYSKMIENRNELFSNTNDQDKLDKVYEEKMRCSVSVNSRDNVNKSSEGFYIYLFPEDYKNKPVDIYMKIEFNHAGVGKTIPMLLPDEESNGIPPFNFYDEDGRFNVDMQKYFKSLYIPIKALYDKNIKKFIYVFPERLIQDGDRLVLNIFEPKVN